MTAGIYEIRNTQTGVRYIGSAKCIKTRLSQHRTMLKGGKHHSIALQRAWDKYGSDCFQLSTVVILEDGELLTTEQRFLDAEHSGDTYNIAKNAVAWMKGRKHSPETLKAMHESRLGNKSRTGVPSEWLGKNLTETHRGNLQGPKSDSHREKISAAKRGVKAAPSGECSRGHQLTGDNVYVSPKRGLRTCKLCIKIRYENNQLALKAARST